MRQGVAPAVTAVRCLATEAIPEPILPGDHLSLAVTADGIGIITIDSKKEKVRGGSRLGMCMKRMLCANPHPAVRWSSVRASHTL